jgi:hypothetical protein
VRALWIGALALAISLAGVAAVVSVRTGWSGAATGTVSTHGAASKDPVLVGAGDIATWPPGTEGNDEATAKVVESVVASRPGRTVVFTLGDNAYESGAASEYEDYYAPTWGRFKGVTRPTPGNHEYNTPGAAGYFGYFRVRPYYAYNLGSWRIYSLNSEIARKAKSPQVRWLRRDLAAQPHRCVLAYWHRPRYSSGPHGNDASVAAIWQTLARARADVVVTGHDHDYERFASRQGMVEFVVGTGGNFLYQFKRRAAGSRARNDKTFGVIAFTLHRGGYAFRFVPVAGQRFTDRGTVRCR